MIKNVYIFITALIIFNVGDYKCWAQKPHVDSKLLKEGLIELKFKDAWRYSPGDNLAWANPDFDDTKWHKINPIGKIGSTDI